MDVSVGDGRPMSLSRQDLARRLASLPADWTVQDLEQRIADVFRVLDECGGALSVTRADEVGAADRSTLDDRLRACRDLGLALAEVRGRDVGDSTQQGMLIMAILDEAWMRRRASGGSFDETGVRHNAALVIGALLRAPKPA